MASASAGGPRHRGILAAFTAHRLAAPISHESLRAIFDRRVEAALGLATRDLRLMERPARAQMRKVGGGIEGAVDEIRKIELENAWQAQRA